MPMANKGEWGEPYVAIKILGDQKLYLSDENGNANPNEWMEIIELIRHEADARIVSYRYNEENINIDIYVNDNLSVSIETNDFVRVADILADDIKNGRGRSFTVSEEVTEFLESIEMKHIKARSISKSDLFLSIKDPRAAVVRRNIGFSVKSEFGHNPTLFNTAKASAAIFKLSNMNDGLMETINNLFDDHGHAAVLQRCESLFANRCNPVFFGYPVARKSGCAAFQENLDLINPRLPEVIEKILEYHFFYNIPGTDMSDVTRVLIERNPCGINRPEIKYPNMIKSFLYAAYCGMTASTLWDGESQVNGGFIKVNADGEVVAHYALESDLFKTYLYNNCYLEFPSTDEKHGDYAKVYKENGNYYFKLNFQIRYR